MKKFLTAFLIVCSVSPTVFAQVTDEEEEMIPIQTESIEPMYRNCSSRYLGNRETCWTTGKTCPAGYDGQAQNCWSRSRQRFYRCGTICESIFRGGH